MSITVVRRITRDAIARLAATGSAAKAERAALDQTLRKLDQQRVNLTDAVADGGDRFPAIRERLAQVERDAHAARERVAKLDALLALDQVNLAKLDAVIALKLKDFAGLLDRHPAQAKTILRKFLRGPIRFTPATTKAGKATVRHALSSSDRPVP